MRYVVEVAAETAAPLTLDELERIAALGGSAAGNPGEHRVETALTVEAADPAGAILAAIPLLGIRGAILAASAMTEAEAERAAEATSFPALAGVTEVADLLGITRQRLSKLRERREFPAPVAVLASGPVWRARDLSTFAEGWQRKAGRPKRAA